MANNDVAKGLWPVRHRNGAPYNGAATRYYVPVGDSTALYLGDPVVTAGGADAGGVQTVTKATAGGGAYMLGPVVSVEPITRDSTVYREASTARYVWVADDPDLVFEIQSDGVAGDLVAADIGLNADWIAGTGEAVYGRSGAELDTSTVATTNTLQLRILGIVQRADNEFTTNSKVEVAINLHTHRNLTGV